MKVGTVEDWWLFAFVAEVVYQVDCGVSKVEMLQIAAELMEMVG